MCALPKSEHSKDHLINMGFVLATVGVAEADVHTWGLYEPLFRGPMAF